jgi:xanthine dehydrogenase small subunit
MRLSALGQGSRPLTRQAVESALLAHLCRCTGWQSIVEAGCAALGIGDPAATSDALPASALTAAPTPAPVVDQLLAQWRAQLEGLAFQSSGLDVVLGRGGFADDSAPVGGLVQLGAASEAPTISVEAARAGATKVQGRNSTMPLVHPVAVPEGEWALTLQTTWVEPAYVEPDASWCLPDALPASPLANGGAFGGKRRSPVPARAHALATQLQHPVRVLWSREDVVRHGPKRPPLALGLRRDGSGVLSVGRTPGSADLGELHKRIHAVAPDVVVEEVEIVGPPVADDLRGAGWVEVLAARCALSATDPNATDPNATDPNATDPNRPAGPNPGIGRADVSLPDGGRAIVSVNLHAGPQGRGTVVAEVWAGEILCPTTLRSYVLGAVHQGLGLVWSEGIAVDAAGEPVDLTIRSFGILTAREMPEVEVILHPEDRWPVNGSDAVFAATVAAAWRADGAPSTWPTRRSGGSKSR